MMLSAFRYRLYPKHEQEKRLNRSLLLLCDLYNSLKAEEMRRYSEEHKSTSQTAFRRLALDARKRDQELQTIYSQVVQNVGDRIHQSFANFFEGHARFPRWKKSHRYNSLTWPQSGFKLDSNRGLGLSGVGYVRIFVHRPLLGKVKRLTIRREANCWYAIFITERDEMKKVPSGEVPISRIRGADLGLIRFATFDDSTEVDYPRFLMQSLTEIERLQRRFSRKTKGSKRSREIHRRVARIHLHIRHQREDFQNKLVHQIFKESDVLIIEKLSVSRMIRNHNLAKPISDASWAAFARRVMFKAELLGKHAVFVDPWGTTQFCHNCLGWAPKSLAERVHRCLRCGIQMPRDENSALLIKRLGILAIKRSPAPDGGSSLAEQGPLPSLREVASPSKEAGSCQS